MKVNKKYILWSAVGIAIVGGAAYFIFRDKDENTPSTTLSPNGLPKIDTTKPYGKRLEAFKNDKNRKQRIVDSLLEAMKGAGTNFPKIKNALLEVEDENFMRILMAYFHKHTYRKPAFGYPPYKEILLDLKGWFKEELSPSEYQELKDMYPNVL